MGEMYIALAPNNLHSAFYDKNKPNRIIITHQSSKIVQIKIILRKYTGLFPEINNFEEAITNEKYFSTSGHINKEGTIEFTKLIFNAYFKPKTKS